MVNYSMSVFNKHIVWVCDNKIKEYISKIFANQANIDNSKLIDVVYCFSIISVDVEEEIPMWQSNKSLADCALYFALESMMCST